METRAVLEPLAPGVGWDALRLPGSSRQALHGFAARRAVGTFALFHGPGRAGKGIVAGALAAHLGMAVWRIDLGGVVSARVDETERNLAAVFDDVRASGALLFFDEGDALIGTRSSVRDAHDRYANQEIAYLLQRLETFAGLAVLTSTAVRDVAPDIVRRCAAIVGIPRMRP